MIERNVPPGMVRSVHPDIQMMRAVAAALPGPEEPLPRFDELADHTGQLRRHLRELISTVESAAKALLCGDATRVAALLTIENARVSLDAGAGPGLASATQHARSLARELRTLCDHHETLASAAVRGAP